MGNTPQPSEGEVDLEGGGIAPVEGNGPVPGCFAIHGREGCGSGRAAGIYGVPGRNCYKRLPIAPSIVAMSALSRP